MTKSILSLKEILEHLVELADKGFYETDEFNKAWDTFYEAKERASGTELLQAMNYIESDFENTFRNFKNPNYYKDAIEEKLVAIEG